MGTGRLKRIAALTALGTASVMVAGAASVPAQLTLPSPGPGTPQLGTSTQVTVPGTSTTVPATPATPGVTVTTPPVSTPKAPKPSSTTRAITDTGSKTMNQTESTVKKTTGTVTQSPTSSGSGGGGSTGGTGSTVTKQTSPTVGGLTSLGGGKSGSGASGALGAVGGGTSVFGGTAGGGSASPGSALGALGFFDGTGGPGGGAGAGGTGSFGSPAGGAGGGGGLPATLSAAGAKQRFALEQLGGCMSAIAPIDRRVLGMRAGGGGAAPLSRQQVAARLGISTRQVRLSERRGLSGLRAAAEQTGCAGAHGGPFAVSGVGNLTPVAFASGAGADVAAQDGVAGDYVPARAAQATPGSPLMDLHGHGTSGPAWLVVLVTILFSVSIAALTRELRHSVGA